VQIEFAAVVHVRAEVQNGTAVHSGHVSAGPASFRYRPLAQAVHCDVVALVHVISDDWQPAIGLHAGHEVPLGDRNVPSTQWVQVDEAADAQVSAESQLGTAVHAVHWVGTVEDRQ